MGASSLEDRGEAVALMGSPVRRRIVDHLSALPLTSSSSSGPARSEGLSATELADLVGLHVTTVRFHLEQLLEVGLLTSSSVRGPSSGRPSKKYAVDPGSLSALSPGQSDLEGPYQVLATLLVDLLAPQDAELTPEQAGHQWAQRRAERDGIPQDLPPARSAGAWLGKVGTVIDLLEEWGYTPQLSSHPGGRVVDVTLHDCPFLDLARSRPEVVCGVHRGLLRGALGAVGEDRAEVSLRPFVGERTCCATLTSPDPLGRSVESQRSSA